MKTKFVLFLTLVLVIFVTSCATAKKIFGKNASKEEKQYKKITDIEKLQSKNNADKMDKIAVLASGVNHALNKVTNREPAVDVAQDINKRVESLAGKPPLEAEIEMWEMIDNLTTENKLLKKKGVEDLKKQDGEIQQIQSKANQLINLKNSEIDVYKELASSTAMKADSLQTELNDYEGWFGLKAVGKGLWRFIKSMTWFLVGGSVLFIILRFAAMSNPIAASVFEIFERVVSWLINTIAVVFPKALRLSGTVSNKTYNVARSILKKIIDNLQSLKNVQSKSGTDITLKELFVELDRVMDDAEKDEVEKIKKELGY